MAIVINQRPTLAELLTDVGKTYMQTKSQKDSIRAQLDSQEKIANIESESRAALAEIEMRRRLAELDAQGKIQEGINALNQTVAELRAETEKYGHDKNYETAAKRGEIDLAIAGGENKSNETIAGMSKDVRMAEIASNDLNALGDRELRGMHLKMQDKLSQDTLALEEKKLALDKYIAQGADQRETQRLMADIAAQEQALKMQKRQLDLTGKEIEYRHKLGNREIDANLEMNKVQAALQRYGIDASKPKSPVERVAESSAIMNNLYSQMMSNHPKEKFREYYQENPTFESSQGNPNTLGVWGHWENDEIRDEVFKQLQETLASYSMAYDPVQSVLNELK